jgi:TonB family protein
MRCPDAAMAVLLALPAAAQPLRPSPPALVSKVAPEYTGEARLARLAGTVLLRVVVGADGRAHDSRVMLRLGLGLDERAVACVSRWRFIPAERDGGRVAVAAPVEVTFRLPEAAGWRLARIVFGSPDGASRPEIVAAPYPPAARYGTASGGVAWRFEIDEQGLPRNVRAGSSSGSAPAREAVTTVRRWRFRPAMRDGMPVPSRAEATLALGDWQLPLEPRPTVPRMALGERVSLRP